MASHGVSRVANAGVRSEEARQKELQRIAGYQELLELVNIKIAEKQYTIEVLALITKLLSENPEYYTIWNHRRRVLGILFDLPLDDPPHHPTEELMADDLQLTFVLLRKSPKCYWIWNHRNWILRKGETLLEATVALQHWLGELQLVSKMLHADSRNFHAWSYRRSVIAQIERMQSSLAEPVPSSLSPSKSLVESEFEYTTKMIKTNLSNFSAWHNRSKLIPRLLNERDADSSARRRLLDDELALICTAINTDPFDQSIWYYHRYLMSTLSPRCPRQSMIALDLSNHDRQKYYRNEMEYIREILDDEADCKWIYESLLHLVPCQLEVDGGTQAFTTRDMRFWLNELKRLDPLRKGRWEELGARLNI